MRVLFATGNPGKARELAAISDGLLDVVTLADLGMVSDYDETGDSFLENSRGKAEYYSTGTAYPVIADDSGLEIDWMHGAPGVHSARFLGENVDDGTRCRTILERMRDVELDKRTARFRCVASCAVKGRVILTAEGIVEGRIHDRMVGEDGFGYDPIFFYPPFNTTFAAVPMSEKNRVSHRNMAFRRLFEKMKTYFKELE